MSSTQHIFARYNFFNLLDLPTDPFGTGLCEDRCAETYQTNAAVIDYTYSIRPNLIAKCQPQRQPVPLLAFAQELGF